MQNLKTDKIIITNKYLYPDRLMKPDSTQTDKKENMICHRFAFLKISKRNAAHLPAPTHWLTPTQAKELQ